MAVATETPTRARAKNRRSRPKLLPLADGYIVGGVAGATIRSMGWFAGLFLAFALIQAARNVTVAQLPWSIALQTLMLQLPRIVLFTIPASLLFGTVSTFTEMSARGELTALMGGGMSLGRMLRAPLVLSVLLAWAAFWLQEVVVPDVELRKSALTQRAAIAVLQTQKFKALVDYRGDGTLERIVQATSFDPTKKTMDAPVIQLFRLDGTIEVEIRARQAVWDGAQKMWVFRDGTTRKTGDKNTDVPITTPFSELSLEAAAPSPDSLGAEAKGAREQLEHKNYEMISWRQLAAYRAEQIAELPTLRGDELANARRDINSETFGIHDKLAMPLVVIAMVLLGAPLGVRPQRTASPGLAMGLSLMVILGYYLLWTFCTQWGKSGHSAPIFTAYLPAFVLAAVGLFTLWRKS